MKMGKRSLSPSERADLKKQQAQVQKKHLSNSLVLGILVFFGLMVLLLVFEKCGWVLPAANAKPALVGLSVLISVGYYLRALRTKDTGDLSNQKATLYTFTVTDYFPEPIANTEFTIYACKTTDNQTVVFQTDALPAGELSDTLTIELLNGKILSVTNYSTGRTVNLLPGNKQLLDHYGDAFYLLDKDIQNL
jgi:hypothetical protein